MPTTETGITASLFYSGGNLPRMLPCSPPPQVGSQTIAWLPRGHAVGAPLPPGPMLGPATRPLWPGTKSWVGLGESQGAVPIRGEKNQTREFSRGAGPKAWMWGFVAAHMRLCVSELRVTCPLP